MLIDVRWLRYLIHPRNRTATSR